MHFPSPFYFYLNGILLQVEVSRVVRDAVGHLVEALARADDAAGLVGAGAGAGARRRRLMAAQPQQEELHQPEEDGGGGGGAAGAGHHDDTHGN